MWAQTTINCSPLPRSTHTRCECGGLTSVKVQTTSACTTHPALMYRYTPVYIYITSEYFEENHQKVRSASSLEQSDVYESSSKPPGTTLLLTFYLSLYSSLSSCFEWRRLEQAVKFTSPLSIRIGELKYDLHCLFAILFFEVSWNHASLLA